MCWVRLALPSLTYLLHHDVVLVLGRLQELM
jgi:hypothetical protein